MKCAALLSVLLAAGCGGGSGAGGGSPPPPNAPVLTIAAQTTWPENQAISIAFTAQDFQGQNVTVSASGPDAARVSVIAPANGTTSNLTGSIRLPGGGGGPPGPPPDFENPGDADGNNTYAFTLTASDGTLTTSQGVTITVSDVAVAPRLVRLATGFDEPVAMSIQCCVSAPAPTAGGIVAEREGRIHGITVAVDGSTITVRPDLFLDLSAEVATTNGMGILNAILASEPGSLTNAHDLYVLLSNLQGDTELRKYDLEADGSKAIKASELLIMRVDQPNAFTGNRGGLLLAAGQTLLVGLGDGGGTGDPLGNAQNPHSLLGKLLRLDSVGDDFPADPLRNYRIPALNPWANGVAGAPEVIGMGLRNPKGANNDGSASYFTFVEDGETVDEIDVIPFLITSVWNYGWPRREGTQAYNGGADDPSFILPFAQRASGAGGAIVDGSVYLGLIEAHQQEFIFGDAGTGRILAFRRPFLTPPPTQIITTISDLTVELTPNAGSITRPVAIVRQFLTDHQLYVLDGDGEIFRYQGP